MNVFFRSSPSNLQVIDAIEHLVREKVESRGAEKIDERKAKNAGDEQDRGQVLPQTAVLHTGRCHEREQGRGAQPNSALEQRRVLERNEPHGSGYLHGYSAGSKVGPSDCATATRKSASSNAVLSTQAAAIISAWSIVMSVTAKHLTTRPSLATKRAVHVSSS